MPIYQKIIAVMKTVHGVGRNRTHTHKKYQFAGYDDVNEALRPLFAEYGIVRVARATKVTLAEQGTLIVDCEVSYVDAEDGSSVAIPMVAVQPSQTTQKSVEAQQVGQAISYAVKNVELKLFALTGNPDSDDISAAQGTPAHATTDGVNARAKELLTMIHAAKEEREIVDLNATIKAEWSDLANVAGFRDAVVASRTIALKRIKGVQT